MRSDYTGPEVSVLHRPRVVRKGRGLRMGAAFLVGEAVALGDDSMLLVSRGAKSGGAVPLALTLRTGKRVEAARARLVTQGGRKNVTLRRRGLGEAGEAFATVVNLDADDMPVGVSVTVRGERLSVTLEA